MRLSIITVTYNSEAFIEDYLKSLIKFIPKDSEIIIIDNNSSDKTLEIVQDFKQINLVESKYNLGFARGCNLGFEKSSGEFVFFLNPDTTIESNIFDELIHFYQSKKNIGIVAPKLVYPDGEVQPSVKNLPTVWGATREYVLNSKNAYSQYVPEAENPEKVESVYGAAMLISREVFLEVGKFDEKYFLYYEDIDLCRKMREKGKSIYYHPGFKVCHIVGASQTQMNKQQLNLKSAKLYHGNISAYLLNLIFWIPRIKRKFQTFF